MKPLESTAKPVSTSASGLLPDLLNKTAESFDIDEVSADKAYASVKNFKAIDAVGATPLIPFKDRHTGASGGLFKKAPHFFRFHQDEFYAHYHKRSNVESMIKAKFRDHVRCKTEVAMKNEVLCKILCHNLVCLVLAFYELGIDADFQKITLG